MSLIIYTPQNGEFLRDALNSVAMFFQEDTFQSAMQCFLILSFSFTAYQFITSNKLQALIRYVLTTFFALYALMGINVSVVIQDMQQEIKGLVVDKVPLGMALPASFISQMGRAITLTFGDIFHMPDDLDYNRAGMIFGSRTWISATSAQFQTSPELAYDVSAFIRQCIFSAKLLGSHQITTTELLNAKDLAALYFKGPQSPIFRVIFQNGENCSCTEAAASLSARLTPAVTEELNRLSLLLIPQNPNQFNASFEAANEYYLNISSNAASLLTQNLLINATRKAAMDAFAFQGVDEALMNFTNTQSLQKMQIAEANSFWLASYRLPYYMTVFWMLTLCIFPLVFLMSLFPLTQSVYKIYLQSQAYLWSWPPMFTIIHFFVSLAASHQTNLFNKKTGGITLSNIDALSTINSNFAYTAGALAASVPFLALLITKGLGSVLGHAAQHFGGIAQSLSVSEAQSLAQGNISLANYSGWNQNYDNFNAHKHDSNISYAADKITAQHDNGSMMSLMPDGTMVSNSQPAMSQAAVSLHGSSRVVSSLNQSANQSFQQAEMHRVASDKHWQQASSELSQWQEAQGTDERVGSGLSDSQSNAYDESIRTMKDSLQQYNVHHDHSRQIGSDKAIRWHADSSRQIFGKAAQWASGTSGHAQRGSFRNDQDHDALQAFFNSSEGKSFSDALNRIHTTAQQNHLDVSDTHHLSHSEQFAAHLSKGINLSQQAAQEYSQGLHYQEASSFAKEEASHIESNLSQPFHNYVAERYGKEGVEALLHTDQASLRYQQALANEFFQSEQGQAYLNQEIDFNLKQAKVRLTSHDETDANQLRYQTQEAIQNTHHQSQAKIHQQQTSPIGEGLTGREQALSELRHQYPSKDQESEFTRRDAIIKKSIHQQKNQLTSIQETQYKQVNEKIHIQEEKK